MAKVLKISDVNVKRKKMIRMRVLFGIILFIILFTSSSYIFNRYRFQIHSIEVSGEQAVDENTVKQIVQEKISGKYLFLFKKSNKLFFPRVAIKKQIQSEIPRIDTINIKSLNEVLTISITERSGEYLYCAEGLTEGEKILNDTCYFMDNTSFVFSKAPYFSDNVYFKIYAYVNEPDNVLGKKVFEDKYLERIIIFKNNLEKIGIVPIAINVTEEGNDFLTLESRGGVNAPRILIKRADNLENAFSDLFTFMQDEKINKEINSKYKNLDYINLRFGNKIYYKFRN